MATLGTSTVTLFDLLKLSDPDGSLATVAEVLDKKNAMLWDMPMIEGNLPTGHQHTIRTGLADGTWRMYNQGVQPTKGRTVQVIDTCGMLDALSEIDYDLAKLNGNTAAWRWSQDKPHVEGMGQQSATAIIYGNQATDPEQITGLAPRYNSGALGSGTVSDNMLNGGGTGSDNTSIWLVSWGPQKIHGIYPKGMKGGLEMIDRGLQSLTDGDGYKYVGYEKFFKWKLGVAVADYRYGVRICNIDKSLLVADGGTVSAGADIISLMIKAIHLLPDEGDENLVFYCNKTINTYLDLQTYKGTNMNLTYGEDKFGKKIVEFRGIPVRRVDAILDTEAAVSFS